MDTLAINGLKSILQKLGNEDYFFVGCSMQWYNANVSFEAWCIRELNDSLHDRCWNTINVASYIWGPCWPPDIHNKTFIGFRFDGYRICVSFIFEWRIPNLLIHQRLVSTKRLHILKQTCSFQLHVCLSMCDLLVDSRH